MNRHSLPSVFVGLMLLTEPVLAQSPSAPAAPVRLPDVALPPALDRVLRDYERAWRAGDAAALAALFAEDGFVLQSNRPPVRGRAAIKAAYEGQGGGPLQLRALAFAAEETSGYIIGAYGYGKGPGDTGKFTLTLRRVPGGPWLIVSDMDNANAPPKPR
ncbi:nuclear transport factor 2 family protein [Myxococcus stipitatus]|uniref:YybH family protein n=1 Tax=Myxococcus stipitatus TaxID=83455 RepID=UPI0031455A63